MEEKVYIIILNWNRFEDTAECLESVGNLSYDNYRVLVVDNGSTDGSADKIEKMFPSVTLIRNRENRGFAGGNNQAMKQAMDDRADCIWLLNNDTVVDGDVLTKLVDAVRPPEVGLASPLICYFDSPDEVQFCGSVIDWKNREIRHIENPDRLRHLGSGKDLSLWGTALIIKRTVIETVGYLNEKYFAYHEDEEFCMRVARAGYRAVVVPGARVLHKNSRSTGSNDAPMQVFLRARNLFFLWMDAPNGEKKIRQFRKYLAHIVSYGGSLVEKAPRDSVDACLDGVWHAMRGMGGPRNPGISMPAALKGMFRFLFSWHPYLWACLLQGDFAGIGSNLRRRLSESKSISSNNGIN